MTRYAMILFAVLWLSGTVLAQTVVEDTLTWHVDQIRIIQNDSLQNYVCKFKSYGESRIVWLQDGDLYRTEFTVSSVAGQWTDLAKDGNVLYYVSSGPMTGTILFSRVSGIYSVAMNFTADGSSIFPWHYLVNQISNP